MALDFPANPTDGQIYGSYVYSATSGVWKAREESAAPAVVSPTQPTTANPGDIWVDSSDGIAYVRYDDGTSAQWMELISSGVTSLALKADKTYVDSQDLLKANLSGASFTGTVSGKRFIATTPTDAGSTGGVGIKAPDSGAQTSAYLQFVNNAYTAQWAALEATPSSELKLNAIHVLMPNQPSFRARVNVSTTYGAGWQKISATTEVHDNASNYNASISRFTAPVTGIYFVSGSVSTNGQEGDGTIAIAINGSQNQYITASFTGSGSYQGPSVSAAIKLIANDYVELHRYFATSVSTRGADWSGYFSAHLLG